MDLEPREAGLGVIFQINKNLPIYFFFWMKTEEGAAVRAAIQKSKDLDLVYVFAVYFLLVVK